MEDGSEWDILENSLFSNTNSEVGSAMLSAQTSTDNLLSYGTILSRNKSIGDIAINLKNKNAAVDDGASDTYARQNEINEWQAQNKLDTFFFLQCLFIFLTSVVLLIFLRRYGFIPTSTFTWIVGVLFLILLGIFYNRFTYTNYKRDNRFWNRRYIKLSDAGVVENTASSCPSQAGESVNLGEQLLDTLYRKDRISNSVINLENFYNYN